MKTLKDLLNSTLVWMAFIVLTGNTVSAQSGGKSALKRMVKYDTFAITPSFKASITEADSTSLLFRVIFSNPEKERVNIRVQSANEGYLYNEDLFDAQYNKQLNFSQVEDGVYIIEISKGRETVRKKFMISTNTYTVKKTNIL